MLFNIYMELVDEVVRGFGLWSPQYVENTHLCFSDPSGSKEMVVEMMEWMRTNKLKLGSDKTDVLFASSLVV